MAGSTVTDESGLDMADETSEALTSPDRTWGFPPRVADDTVTERVARYDAWAKRCSFFAAGLGGLLILVGQATLLKPAPHWFLPVIATVAIAGIVFAGLAYVPFVVAKDGLSAQLATLEAPEKKLAKDIDRFPRAVLFLYRLSLLCLAVAGSLFLIGVWWH